MKTGDWTRVRFGAGTPWRRCWCVISPPDEKEVQKQQKSLKKKSAYERPAQSLKGDIKFYDTKKTKKTQPIATINDAYSAYAIYPQSKPLIDQSTLVKVEGSITIHSVPETTTEGFVFVMPEVHPAVTGFEMMLRWLFPLYDVFALYGRPNRLIADTLDVRSLMFALPQERRYGYLEILDVATLIHESGSQMWKDQEWRARLKDLTSSRIAKMQANGSRQRSRASSYRGNRNSLPSRAGTLRYEDGASIRSTPSLHNDAAPPLPIHRQGSVLLGENAIQTPERSTSRHQRSASEAVPFSTPRQQRSQRIIPDNQAIYTPSRLSYEAAPSNQASEAIPPLPPVHGVPIDLVNQNPQIQRYEPELDGTQDRSSSESDRRVRSLGERDAQEIRQDLGPAPPPAPVVAPPAFAHEAGAKPHKRPQASPELRRANSRMSMNTLSQLADAGQLGHSESAATSGPMLWDTDGQGRSQSYLQSHAQPGEDGSGARNVGYSEDRGQRGVIDDAGKSGTNADHSSTLEGMAVTIPGRSAPKRRQSAFLSADTSQHDQHQNSYLDRQTMPTQDSLHPTSTCLENYMSSAPNSTYSNTIISSPSKAGQPRNSSTNMYQNGSTTNSRAPVADATPLPPIPIAGQRPEPYRLSTSHSITRKPLPSKLQSPVSDPPSPTSRSSLESLRECFVDADALDQIIPRESDRSYTMDSKYDHHLGEHESVYDNDSTVSPDYASTRRSTETKRSKASVERPRAGVLKTVGIVEPVRSEVLVGDTRYGSGVAVPQTKPAIPSVDFGPTPIYRPGTSSRASTAGVLMQPTHERSKSDRMTPSPRNQSPPNVPSTSDSYPSERLIESYERSPSRNLTTPDGGRRTPGGIDNEHRRSVAWQPGATIGSGSPSGRQPITPEQFVQQRAAASRITPVYAHGRKASGQGTPPTVSRNSSGEWPIQPHSRQVSLSKEAPVRPQSRGTTISMNPSGDYSAHLSAREQEHVARVTGSPLINMATNANRQAPQGGGLIGAIEAREKEKKDIKDGLSGHMVQHAIAQRQQHSQGHQNTQQQFPTPSPQMQMPGQFPSSPFLGASQQQYGWTTTQQFPPQQRQQQWTPPAAQQYWSATQTSAPQQLYQGQLRQSPQIGTLQQQQQQMTLQQQQAAYQQQLAYQQLQQQQQGQLNSNPQKQYGPYLGNK